MPPSIPTPIYLIPCCTTSSKVNLNSNFACIANITAAIFTERARSPSLSHQDEFDKFSDLDSVSIEADETVLDHFTATGDFCPGTSVVTWS